MFFRSNGFRAVSVLRNFYDDTPEDAYLMQYRFDSQPPPPSIRTTASRVWPDRAERKEPRASRWPLLVGPRLLARYLSTARDLNGAECAIETRSVSEVKRLAAPAYASGYDVHVNNPG